MKKIFSKMKKIVYFLNEIHKHLEKMRNRGLGPKS